LLDHTCAQIGIDQTAFGSVDCIVKHSSRNLFFFGEAREPRTFKDRRIQVRGATKMNPVMGG
jgi:hypothetical protein